MRERTEIKTPVYKVPEIGQPLIFLLPNREIDISDVKERQGAKFGLTSAGWVLMKDRNTNYFHQPLCPICFCDAEAEEDHPFKLPCCGNTIHAECFLHQVESGSKNIATGEKARKYESTHLKCCFCRELYTEKQNDFRYKQEICHALRQENSDYYSAILQPAFDLHRNVQNLIKAKEQGLPEEERGGWAIYNCDKCTKMYIPGKLSCAEELNLNLEEQELVCPECEWCLGSEDHRCFEHGKKYAIFKCDSCCSIASWDCYSNHYCEPCHQRACAKKFHPCPGRGKCPLGMPHPPNSAGIHGRSNFGFVIGCYKCQDDTYEPEKYNKDAPDPFLISEQKGRNFEAMFNYKPREALEVSQPIPPEFDIIEEIQEPAYDHFLGGFGNESSESESESEESSEESIANDLEYADVYENFINGFNYPESEAESESEDAIAYGNFLEGFESEDESESEEIGLAYVNFLEGFGDKIEESDSEVQEVYDNFNAGFEVESEEESDSEESDTLFSDTESEEIQSDVEPQHSLSVPAPRKKYSFPDVMFAGQCSFELESHESSFEIPKMMEMSSW